MLVAATVAGMAFNGALLGAAHALVLPSVCAFNLDACPERFRDITEGLGVSGPHPPAADTRAGEPGIAALREACGLPATPPVTRPAGWPHTGSVVR